MLSRAKPAIGPGSTTPAKEAEKKKKKLPKVEDFLNLRDYTGAITLLEVHVHKYNAIENLSPRAACGKYISTYKRNQKPQAFSNRIKIPVYPKRRKILVCFFLCCI